MPTSIMIIYTGGTIGMVQNPETGALQPFNFSEITQQIPDIKRFKICFSTYQFEPPIDSANVNPQFWIKLANIIEQNYHNHDGFVILHGTDTMAYSASALSFMLENLQKPVIFTGSQLPIGMLRTDGRENLITAIEIAADRRVNKAVVPEVCIYFESKLFRGNRTTKYSAEQFNAFRSPNYPALAEVGIHIKYNHAAIRYPTIDRPLRIHKNLNTQIAILKLFPGITQNMVEAILNIPNLKAVVLETFGSGNAPSEPWFIEAITNAILKGIIILNASQCAGGSVDMGKYSTGIELQKHGVISGFDTTTEAAVTKLMCILGHNLLPDDINRQLNKAICGEISPF